LPSGLTWSGRLTAIGVAQFQTRCGAGNSLTQLLNPAELLIDTDNVTRPDRAVEHQNKSADEVAGNSLQTEAQRTPQFGQGSEIDADRVQRQQTSQCIQSQPVTLFR